MSLLTERVSEVVAIGILVWFCDVVLLASRGQGEVRPLHVIVALGACCLVSVMAVLLTRRYRIAMVAITLFSIAVLWMALFGPALPSRKAIALAIIAAAVAIGVAAYAPPKRLAMAIPVLLLLHHFLITRQLPGWMTFAAAIVLIPITPRVYDLLRARPRLLVTVSCLAIAAALPAAAMLYQRVDSRTWSSSRHATRAGSDTNIVLIVLDTLRADRLGAFGYRARQVTPFLDSFARTAAVFPRSYAASSWTIPSVASMFTGLTCGQHGVIDAHTPLPANHPTLAETLRHSGYYTIGVNANFLLDEEIGFTRGFDRYTVLWRMVRGNRSRVPSIWDDLNVILTLYYRDWFALVPGWTWKARAADVTARTVRALDEAPQGMPLFLYVHYVDPHAPCDPASGGRFQMAESDRSYDPNWSLHYDGEIRDLDAALQTLMARIDQRLDPRKTVVIIVADHGEQLGEDGGRGHGKNLSEATIRVPLIVRSPALPAGVRPQEPFSTARVFDLVRVAAGIPASMQSPAVVTSSLRLGNIAQRAVIDGNYKFVQQWQVDPPSLIDEAVYALPDEKHNILAANRGVADRLRLGAAADPLSFKVEGQMSDEMRAKLRALGYLR
jgi:arylsulfatase A-like enzyme